MNKRILIILLPLLLALGLVTVAVAAAARTSTSGAQAIAPVVQANLSSAMSASNPVEIARQSAGQSQPANPRQVSPRSNSAMMPGFLQANDRQVYSVPQVIPAWAKPESPAAIEGWDGNGIYAPTVIADSGIFKMWYGGGDAYSVGRIGYAESTDGINWTRPIPTPVLDVGASGEWDDTGVGQPSVIKNGSLYQMWYFGADHNGVKQIGYASSSDGLSWTKYASNPVLSGDPGTWDESEVGGPRVVYDGVTYHLWYHGYSGSCCDSIGYATSPDGVNWTKYASNPVFGPGDPGEWDETYVFFTSVLSDTDLVQMWYSVGYSETLPIQGIGYVTSTNGIDWTRLLTGPVLTPGPDAWDAQYIFAPTVIYEGGLYHMWYTGNDENCGHFGYATSTDGITWEKSASNPVFAPGLTLYANYAHDWVVAYTTANTPITVTVEGKGFITGTTDNGGEFFSLGGTWSMENPPDISPGDVITAVTPAMTTDINPVGSIDGLVDGDTDTIAGTINAPFGALTLTVRCDIWEPPYLSIVLTGVPANGGSYTCDFGALGWDFQVGQAVDVIYFEPDGDGVMNVFGLPWMRANYAHDWVGGNFPAGYTLWITVTDSAYVVKATAEITSSPGGGWGGDGFQTDNEWLPQRPDIQEGDWVYFTSDNGYNAALQIGVITGAVNINNDSVGGSVYADFTEDLAVECHPWGGPPTATVKTSTAGPDGDPPYFCQWDPSEWDIQPGQDVAVMYIEPSGNRVINVFQQPKLNIRTNYGDDWIEGNFEAGHTMWITVTNNLGEVKATAYGETGPIEWWGGQSGFSTNYNVLWQGMQPDLQPTDLVIARLENGLTAESSLGIIDAYAYPSSDIVSGTIYAPFTEPLHVDCGIWEDGGPGMGVDGVNPYGGKFTCDFTGSYAYDIIPGNTIGVSYNEPDGDMVLNLASNPAPRLSIHNWTDGVPAEGNNLAIKIQYWNQGDAPTENAIISATLEGGLLYLTDTLGIEPTGNGTPGNPLIWDLGTIQPDMNSGPVFYLFVHVTAEPSTRVTNTVQIENGYPYDLDDLQNRTSQWNDWVFYSWNEISVGKGAWTSDPAPGSQFVYNVNACNNDNRNSARVVLSDTLPLSTTLVSWWGQHPGWKLESSSAHQLEVSRLSLGGWQCSEVYLRVQLDANVQPHDSLYNAARVFVSNDEDLSNNRAEIWHEVGVPHTNLGIHKEWNWGGLVPGGEIRYNIQYYNDGNLPAEDVYITETLPASTTFLAAFWYDEAGGHALTPYLETDEIVVWKIGDLDNGYSRNFEVDLHIDPQAKPPQELVNTTELTRLPGEDRYTDNTSTWTETIYGHGPNLRVRKTGGWHGWGEGHNAWYNLSLENVGDRTVMSVTVTDTLPISMDLDGNLITSWSEVIAYERNDPEGWFSLTFREVRPTQRWDIWMSVINPNPDPVPGGQFFTNFAEVMQVDGEPTYLDNMTDYTLASGLDLYVQKSLVAGGIVPGEEATFSLLFGNQQDMQFWRWGLQGTAWLTDVLPANSELVAATQRFCSDQSWCDAWPIVQGDMLKWGIWPIAPGAWNELYVTVRLTDTLSGSTTLTNLATITSDQPNVDLEPGYDNNTAVYTFTTMLPTYAVDKVYESSAIAGTPVTYTLTVNNSGSLTGSGIMVSDQLPEDLTYLSGGSYNPGTGEVMWTLPSLAVGSSAEVAFVGQLPCQPDIEVVNAFYRVADSNERVISPWGTLVALPVVPPTISASFEASAVSIEQGDTVYFTSTAETDGAALIYAWDFGGNGTAEGSVVSHTFNLFGRYGVYLIVMDDCGYGADYYMMIEVNKPEEKLKSVYLPLIQK